jgi:hypothetical protein
MARPTSYTDDIPRQAEIVIALGATDKNIADVFGVTERTRGLPQVLSQTFAKIKWLFAI